MAAASNSSDQEDETDRYTYSSNLDIHRIISMDEVPHVCEVVPARMVYVDSKGEQHTLEYRVMGSGCTNN